MNESTDLGNASILEPVLRLRSGHGPSIAVEEHHDSDQCSEQQPLFVKQSSSEQEKVNNQCHEMLANELRKAVDDYKLLS